MAMFSWLREFVRKVSNPYELPVTRPLFDEATLLAAAPYAKSRDLQTYYAPLVDACWRYQINTNPRIAAFLAQVAHESASFSRVEEIASGDAYEGRLDLGNAEPGDGPRYKGHGLIQITGRWNHEAAADALGVPRVSIVGYLKSPVGAALSAAWYWNSRRLNDAADLCTQVGFDACTRAINGGFNGKADRDRRYRAVCAHLGVEIR